MNAQDSAKEQELLKSHPWYKPGKWYTSPITWLPEVRATMPYLPERVHFSDPTLREAEDNILVSYTQDQKVEIAHKLSDLGVETIDSGFVGNPDHEKTLKEIVSSGVLKENGATLFMNQFVFDISGQLSDLKKAVDHVAEMGSKGLNPICAAPIMTTKQIDDFVDLIRYVTENHPGFTLTAAFAMCPGSFVYINNLPTMRASYEWQLKLAKIITDAGLDGVAIADSMGTVTPPAWKYIANEFRKAIGPDKILSIHNHNDFGLATANALAGVEGGANWIDAVICGLGARAGNTALEEIAFSLEAQYGIGTGIKLDKLNETAKFIQEVTGAKVEDWKPVIGDKLWYESSFQTPRYMQAKWAGKDFFEAAISETYNPKVVGQSHELKFGFAALSPEAVEGFLAHEGLKKDKETIGKIIQAALKEIDERAARGENKWLEIDEVTALCKKFGF